MKHPLNTTGSLHLNGSQLWCTYMSRHLLKKSLRLYYKYIRLAKALIMAELVPPLTRQASAERSLPLNLPETPFG